jgi:iron-sulfur cluster repair protein YtfE (RIC family)
MIDLMGPAPTFDTPFAVMEACHRRIERRLEQLLIVAERLSEPASERHAEALRVLDEARHHFATAGAHHTADEEQDLFPMLRATSDVVLHDLLEVLEADHRILDAMHAELDALGDRLRARVTPEDAAALRDLASDLKVHYDRHIRQEDEHVMPKALALLQPEQVAALGARMRHRRGL